MAPLRFDKARIEARLAAASEQLDGEWRLIEERAGAPGAGCSRRRYDACRGDTVLA